jgi:hypothetical protein
MDLREIGLGGVDWIRLAQDRDRWRAVVSAVMNLRVLAPRSQLVIPFSVQRLQKNQYIFFVVDGNSICIVTIILLKFCLNKSRMSIDIKCHIDIGGSCVDIKSLIAPALN